MERGNMNFSKKQKMLHHQCTTKKTFTPIFSHYSCAVDERVWGVCPGCQESNSDCSSKKHHAPLKKMV